ncbi:hypothetical protein B0H13DRAFT_812065 [Mycena leptocephala]|nr:hypothetical protein B0H13DRAFT_812065 [Mycena leptocephala]
MRARDYGKEGMEIRATNIPQTRYSFPLSSFTTPPPRERDAEGQGWVYTQWIPPRARAAPSGVLSSLTTSLGRSGCVCRAAGTISRLGYPASCTHAAQRRAPSVSSLQRPTCASRPRPCAPAALSLYLRSIRAVHVRDRYPAQRTPGFSLSSQPTPILLLVSPARCFSCPSGACLQTQTQGGSGCEVQRHIHICAWILRPPPRCTSLRRMRAPAVTSSVSARPSYHCQPVQTHGRRREGWGNGEHPRFRE